VTDRVGRPMPPDRQDDWEDHWDRYEASARENPAQAYRRRVVFGLLDRDGPPARLLDIGSGQGDLLLEAHRRWPTSELAGIELSRSGIEAAAVKVPVATFVQRDLLVPAAPDPALAGWATHAVCTEVLEHVEDPAELLRQASHHLSRGCRLVITVPGGPMSRFDQHIGHRTHYTPGGLRDVVLASGLVPERVMGAGFPFFNLYRRLVILRGAKLIDDVDASDVADLPASARLMMRGFDAAFRLNLDDTRWGTQIVAVAVVP
jgi:SAM-dependent methyltransferase